MHRGPPAPLTTFLINTPGIELWPGGLLRARSNHDARMLARASRVLRRKCDGAYLAADLPEGLQPLVPHLRREPGLDAALDALEMIPAHARNGLEHVGELALHRLHERLDQLGLDEAGYTGRTGLVVVAEPDWLAFAGFDRYRRPLWLRFDAARAWLHLRDAALRDDVVLEAISGYRSHDYQLGIFERKLARGLAIDEILAVNAAPGYSEHHGGLALDIGAPGEPPAEEAFEGTPAFRWLQDNAAGYGFHLSYPRDNPHGIVYEPWHWRFLSCMKAVPTIADAWAGELNNFNLMRLVAAWLVIYGHAHAITGLPGHDGIASLTQLRAAGAVAVDMFFAISGFLIAASLERNTVRGYLVSRGLRILPALLACVALTTLVLGPLLTSAADYWTQPQTWDYLLVNASLLLSRFHLPGVFAGHPTDVVNGSLWTLPNEARLYVLLLVAWLLGLLAPRRYTPLWVLAMLAGYALAWRYWPLPDHIQKYGECAAFFTTGALLWVNRTRVRLSGGVVLALVAGFALLRGTAWSHLPYFALLTYGTLYLGLRVRLPRIRHHDLSYGLYLYGWPAQQLAWLLPAGKSIAGNIAIATAIALACAALSWWLVERPALRWKKRWVARAPAASAVGAQP